MLNLTSDGNMGMEDMWGDVGRENVSVYSCIRFYFATLLDALYNLVHYNSGGLLASKNYNIYLYLVYQLIFCCKLQSPTGHLCGGTSN